MAWGPPACGHCELGLLRCTLPKGCTVARRWHGRRFAGLSRKSVTPDELMVFSGTSIGFEDVAVEYARTGRAPLDETVTYVG
jgi:hypothetical protein